MATILPLKIPELIKLSEGALSSTLKQVTDGNGGALPLKVSTTQLELAGLLWPTAGAVEGKILTVGVDGRLVWSDAQAASGYVPLTGGTMTGPLNTLTVTETVVNIANTSGTMTYDLSKGSYFTATVAGITTVSIVNAPTSGSAFGFVIELKNGGSANVIWPASVTWESNIAPTLSSAAVDLVVLITRNGGNTWYGSVRMGS